MSKTQKKTLVLVSEHMMGCLYSGCFRGILVVTSSLVFGNMTEQSYNMAGSLLFSVLFLVMFGIIRGVGNYS